MRFKKGDKVEIFYKREGLSGAWRGGTIFSGSDRKYIVMYDGPQPSQGGLRGDRVSRSALRPKPPLIGGLENLHPGDEVEVFHGDFWRAACVVSTADGMRFFVRPNGSAQELCVDKIDLRLRLFWLDDQWFVTEKNHQNINGTTTAYEEFPPTKKIKMAAFPVRPTKKIKLAATRMVDDWESVCAPSSRYDGLKRKYSLNSSFINANVELVRKVSPKPVKRHHSLPLDKLDALASLQVRFDEKSLRDSFTGQLFETEIEESVASNDVSFFPSRDLEFNDIESKALYHTSNNRNSTRDPRLQFVDPEANFSENILYDGNFSSSSGWGNASLSKVDATPACRLELRAYRDILKALYAYGDISWEHELMITNLRLSHKISIDEHLLIVKQIIANHS